MAEEVGTVTQEQLYNELKETRKEVLDAVKGLADRVDRVSTRLDGFSEWKSQITGSVQSLHSVIVGIHSQKSVGPGSLPEKDSNGSSSWRVWLVDKIFPLGVGALLGALLAHLVGG